MNDHPWLVDIPETVATDLLQWAETHRGKLAGLPEIPRESPASALADTLNQRLIHNPGYVVLRSLPVDGISTETLSVAYAAIAVHLGEIVPQTVSGTMLYSVRDEGYQIDRDYGQAGVRTSKTTSAFGFHTDSPAKLAGHTPDIIGLFVLRTAKSGGASAVADGRSVYRTLAAENPAALTRLCEPFWVDRRAELPPGESPIVRVPVFSGDVNSDTFAVRYVRLYIVKAHELAGEPLTPEDLAALDAFDEAAGRHAITMQLEPGDIQFLNNITHLHGRTAYQDHPEPGRKRHYLRIWVESSGVTGSSTIQHTAPAA